MDVHSDFSGDEMFAVDEPRPERGVGRLSDDLDIVAAMEPDRTQAATILFIHLAPLPRTIAHEVGQEGDRPRLTGLAIGSS